MECITCALCIDACDDVMDKVGKPRGLIAYATLVDEEAAAQGIDHPHVWKRVFRFRTLLYFVLWSGIGIAMTVALFMRSDVDITVERDRSPVYVTLSDGSIRNGYTLKAANKTAEPQEFGLTFLADKPLGLEIQGQDSRTFTVDADSVRSIRVFITGAPDPYRPERLPLKLWLQNLNTRDRAAYETVFLGPEPTGK